MTYRIADNGVERDATPDEIAEIEARKAAGNVPVVPQVVTMRQARLALLNAGLLNNVVAAINAMPAQEKERALIEWEYSQSVERKRALVAVLGPALGLTESQVDELFIEAAKL